MSSWLDDEAKAVAGRVQQPHLDRLAALGVAGGGLASLGRIHAPFGVDRVQRRSGGQYEPAEEGSSALIVPVCWPEHHEGLFGETIILWPVIDLIAISTDNPAAWLWRTGTAWALGGHLLEFWEGEPLDVVATPLDWLRAGGDAVCILDWSDDSPAWRILRMISALVVNDDLLARRLAAAIERTAPRPKFIKNREIRRHVA